MGYLSYIYRLIINFISRITTGSSNSYSVKKIISVILAKVTNLFFRYEITIGLSKISRAIENRSRYLV